MPFEQGLWSKTALNTEDVCTFLTFSEPQFAHLYNRDRDASKRCRKDEMKEGMYGA